MPGSNAGLVLQPRDYTLLRALTNLRVVDRESAKVIGPFGSTTRANTRLQALARYGLLVRHAVGTTAGGRKYLYALSTKGARIADVPYRAAPWTRDTLLGGSMGLEHQLRLNALHLLLMYRPIPLVDIRVRTWQTFLRPVAAMTTLIPDAYIDIEAPAGVRAWFVELDRGTESGRTWRTKAERYVQYAVSGAFASPGRPEQFGVLVIAPSARRVHSLRSTVARVTTKLFWFATYEALEPDTFWTHVWWRPTGADHHSLIPALPCGTAPTVGA